MKDTAELSHLEGSRSAPLSTIIHQLFPRRTPGGGAIFQAFPGKIAILWRRGQPDAVRCLPSQRLGWVGWSGKEDLVSSIHGTFFIIEDLDLNPDSTT